MKINTINFGKLIPVNQCRVINRSEDKLVNATIYEYDCKDLFDVYEVGDLDYSWDFRDLITSGMHSKYLNQVVGKEDNKNHYYCAKDDDGNIIGLCYTNEDTDSIDIKLVTSEQDKKYKYVGQSILTSLAQKVLNTGREKLKIKAALSDVKDFYAKACGFRCTTQGKSPFGDDFEITKEEIPAFIARTNHKKEIQTQK